MNRAARPTVALAADTARARTVRLRIEVQHRQIHRGDGLLELHVHVDHPVLQHLEAADRLPELLALLAVFDGVGQHLSHAADRFGADRRRALVAGLGERRPRLALLAEQCIAGQAQSVEHQIGCATIVDRPIVMGLDSRCVRIGFGDEQRNPARLCAR